MADRFAIRALLPMLHNVSDGCLRRFTTGINVEKYNSCGFIFVGMEKACL